MHGRPERRPASVRAVEAMLSKPTAVPPPSRRKFWIGAAGAGAISLASVSLFPRVFRDPDRRLNAQAVLLTKIENVTGDPKLDGATALLEGQLGQSARFNLMSRGRVSELLQRMQKPLDTKVDPLTAREIALRNGGTAVVYGLLSRLASNLRLEIRIEEPGSKPDDVRASFDKQFSAAGEQDLLRQIRAAAVWIRETVGEPESDIRRHNQGPGEQTTSSWDALALYERGRELRFQSQYDEAEAMFNEALRLDPDYASALRELADMQVSIHRLRDGYATWKRAVQSSRKRQLNTRERFRLESMYFDDIGAWAEAENVNRLWMASYDSDEMPRVLLSNLRLHQYHPEEALALLLEAERKLPENLMVLAHLTPQLALAGRFEDAHRRVEKLKRLNHVRDARHYETRILAMEGRWRESLESADLAMQAAGSDYQFRHRPALVRASVLTEMGRAAEAERELLALAEEDGKAGAREARAGKLETAAYLALRRGDVMAARKLARQAVESPDFLGEFAPIVLARAGGVDDAERVLEQWGKTMPPGLPRFERQRLRLLGEIQLARRAWKPALETLRQADKLTSVRRINDSLARAYAMSGDRDEATKCYRTLVEREKYHWLTDCAEPGFGANVRKGASSLEAKG
jgi:tetratricopeptide (TPR) repeat protein